MSSQFKARRFMLMVGVLVFVVCGVTAFYTHRAAHGRTSEERAAYAEGREAGEQQSASGGKLPTAAGLHMIAQTRFKAPGSGNEMTWKSAFANGYTEGFTEAQSGALSPR